MRFEKNIEEHYLMLTILEDKLNSTFAPILKEEFILLNATGIKNIILNLSNVKYIDSSGLSALLRGNSICDSAKGYFVVCNPSEHVQKLINISRLETVLNIALTKQEAIDAIHMAVLEDEIEAPNEAEAQDMSAKDDVKNANN